MDSNSKTEAHAHHTTPHHPELVFISIDGIENKVLPGRHRVADLKRLADLSEAKLLGELVHGKLSLLPNEGTVEIKGREVFVSPAAITIDGKSHYTHLCHHTVAELKEIGGVELVRRLARLVEDKHEPLANEGKVEVVGGECFVSEVSIRIAGKEYLVWRGKYSVVELKKIGGVPLAHELEQKLNGKLVPLDDGGSVEICGGEVFVSHPRDAQSS